MKHIQDRNLLTHAATEVDDSDTESAPSADSDVLPLVQFEPGTILSDDYRIESLLASGGMGCVYKGLELSVKRGVAIKVARPEERFQTALRQEAQALAAISHFGVPQLFALRSHKNVSYIVMEQIIGNTLQRTLSLRGAHVSSFNFTEVAQILTNIAEALGAIHDAGVVHRDVKPENVVVSGDGRTVLVDLGIFRCEAQNFDELSGTPGYIAPEEVAGQTRRELARRVDFYGLGILGYELLTGERPGGNDSGLLVCDKIADVRTVREDTPAGLAGLIWDLTRADPTLRPAAASEIVQRLEHLIEKQRRRARGTKRPRRDTRRHEDRIPIQFGAGALSFDGITGDLSATGLLILAPQISTSIGEKLVMRLQLPEKILDLEGVVRWSSPSTAGEQSRVGVELKYTASCDAYREYVSNFETF